MDLILVIFQPCVGGLCNQCDSLATSDHGELMKSNSCFACVCRERSVLSSPRHPLLVSQVEMESPSPSLRRQAWVQTSRQWQTLENDPQAPSQPPPPPPPPFFSTEQQHFTDGQYYTS